jgi:hypothetical protein
LIICSCVQLPLDGIDLFNITDGEFSKLLTSRLLFNKPQQKSPGIGNASMIVDNVTLVVTGKEKDIDETEENSENEENALNEGKEGNLLDKTELNKYLGQLAAQMLDSLTWLDT